MERYKLLIVDDDLLVRLDLHTLIDWNAMGIDLIDDASNGIEAIDSIEANQPDIVILDLGMPLMNGLEVIAALIVKGFKGKIIVLSCHEDFENVKEAMQMGAIDYLRKHLFKKEELADSIRKAIDIIKNESVEKMERNKLVQLSEQNRKVIQRGFIRDLINGIVNIGDWKTVGIKIKDMGVDIDFTKYVCIIIEIDDLYLLKEKYFQEQLKKLLSSFDSIIESMVKNWENCLEGGIREGEYCIFMNFQSNQSYMNANNIIYEYCTQILNNVVNYLNIQVSIGISKLFNDISSLQDSYSQARLALDGKLYLGKNRIIHFSEIESYTNTPKNQINKVEIDIIEAITNTNSDIGECVGQIFDDFRKQQVKTEYFRLFSFELLVLTSRILKEYNIGYESIFSYEYLPYHYVMHIETIDEIQLWFEDICIRISSEINKRGLLKNKNLNHEVSRSLEYIEMNYNRDISLQEIADYVNLSRTYFSNLFKKETGVGFVEYLIKYRIEKAKELLNDSCRKIYEVGEICGFSNYRYFARTFKRITNLSPGEYREKINQ